MDDRLLDYIALGMLIFVVLTIIYGGMFIHDIPYQMAKKRNHPHKDAIHTACWVSLFLLHIIWPFLWIWASLYKPDVGWNMKGSLENKDKEQEGLEEEINSLKNRITTLEQKLEKKEK